MRKIVASAFLLVGTLAGILLERHVGIGAVIEWTGMRHALSVRRIKPTEDRQEVPIDVLRGKRTMVTLAFGQSNAGNSGETRVREHAAVYEYYRGRLYVARDPLLGADGNGGSIWPHLGARAVDSGAFDAVVLVAFSVGAAEIARFAPGGSLHDALLARAMEVERGAMHFTHLLWQHGEADAMRATAPEDYARRFHAMVRSLRDRAIEAPVYVALSTRCGKARPSEPIRRALQALPEEGMGIRPGPDTDQLGFAHRYDGCHFSTEGMEKAADLWWEAIRPDKGN